MTRIKYSKGRTINLGNFESERIDIGIELDVPDGAADLETKFALVYAWVNDKLKQENGRG